MKIHQYILKLGIAIIALSIIFFVLISTTVGKFAANTHRNINENSDLVGKKIVLMKDTLMIVNYNFITNDYELENGVTISVKLVKKLNIIKE